MKPITYLPEELRLELQSVQYELDNCYNFERIAELQKRLGDINSQRKPLHECNIEECQELKKVVYDKYTKLLKTTKLRDATQFRMMLEQIDTRMIVINMQIQQKQSEVKSDDKRSNINHIEKREHRPSESKPRSSRGYWTTDIAFDDESNNSSNRGESD